MLDSLQVIDAIKTMKAQGKQLFREEIHDQIQDKIKYTEFTTLLEDMVAKKLLSTTDKLHYELH